MAFLDKIRGKKKEPNFKERIEEQAGISETDIRIMMEALEKGTPCIPFIPISALRQSMTVVKPEGFKGFFIARIPALYEDGTIRHLYKEEFVLWLAIQGAVRKMNEKGRTYFFLGVDQPAEIPADSPFINPRLLYQQNLTLFNIQFDEKLEFFQFEHAPGLEVTYIPAERNVKVNKMSIVNFSLAARLHPKEEREDPSATFQYYNEWKSALYPTSGDELREMMKFHVQIAKDTFRAEWERVREGGSVLRSHSRD
jgi:hypothetical protein